MGRKTTLELSATGDDGRTRLLGGGRVPSSGGLSNPQVRRWLKGLSLRLFVLGRYEENVSGRPAQMAKTPRPKRSN